MHLFIFPLPLPFSLFLPLPSPPSLSHTDTHTNKCHLLVFPLIILYLETGPFMGLELSKLTLAGQQFPAVPVSAFTALGFQASATIVSFLAWVPGIELRSSCLEGKCFTECAIFLVPIQCVLMTIHLSLTLGAYRSV